MSGAAVVSTLSSEHANECGVDSGDTARGAEAVQVQRVFVLHLANNAFEQLFQWPGHWSQEVGLLSRWWAALSSCPHSFCCKPLDELLAKHHTLLHPLDACIATRIPAHWYVEGCRGLRIVDSSMLALVACQGVHRIVSGCLPCASVRQNCQARLMYQCTPARPPLRSLATTARTLVQSHSLDASRRPY